MADVEDEFNLTVFSLNCTSPINNSSTFNDSMQDTKYLQFIVWGIMLPIIVCFGLVGNILTMCVLFRREMRSTTVLYLRALVLTDSIVLLLAVCMLTPLSISHISPYFSYHMFYRRTITYVNYAAMTVQTCNVWITVFVSVERYIAVCHLFYAPRINTKRNTLIAIISVAVFSITFNLPRLFELGSKTCLSEKGDSYKLYITEFGQGNGYKVIYKIWMYAIVVFIIPLSALFVFNIRIITALVRMAKRSRFNLRVTNGSHNEANVSLVLVFVVAVFIICQTPRLIAQFDIFSLPVFLKFVAVGNTMLVLNSSVNFLIYVFVGRQFRKVFIQRVCHRRVNAGTGHAHDLQPIHHHTRRTGDDSS